MGDKFKYTHTITPSLDYNQWLKRLDTQPNVPTNQSPQNF